MSKRESYKTKKDSEHFKIYQRVFNGYTMKNLNLMVNKEMFKTLDFPISTGKEADVFRGSTKDKENVAIKIYRVETGDFKNMWDYIEGDPRFVGIRRNRNSMVNAWCKKEYRNLSDAFDVGLRVPSVIGAINNVLVMEFIGENGKASPMLKDVIPKDPNKVIEEILFFIRRLYDKAKLVHADMSAFNILMKEDNPYFIDMGQTVSLRHPRSTEFLKRDLYNIGKMAKKYSIKIDPTEIYNEMVKQ